MSKRKRRNKDIASQELIREGQARAGGLASFTFGRARKFKNKKKEEDKKKARRKVDEE